MGGKREGAKEEERKGEGLMGKTYLCNTQVLNGGDSVACAFAQIDINVARSSKSVASALFSVTHL